MPDDRAALVLSSLSWRPGNQILRVNLFLLSLWSTTRLFAGFLYYSLEVIFIARYVYHHFPTVFNLATDEQARDLIEDLVLD